LQRHDHSASLIRRNPERLDVSTHKADASNG
jgi:hypothetical protein